ncbi:MAG: tRNA (guanosine(18)-2'-O)-methyltransferase TrmH [Pseudomonadota bacterium]
MTPERFERLRRCLERRQPDLTVLADNVHKSHNIAAILRTADAVGLYGIHAVSDTNEFRHHHMVSGGSKRWVNVTLHESTRIAIDALRQDGFRIVAAHPTPDALDYRHEDYTKRVAVMMGPELTGFSDDTLATVDGRISIPMEGLVSSLNVSVAAALILFEARRQRESAGLYDECRLDNRTFQSTLFEWAYPDLARRCNEKNLAYPPLGPDGALLANPLNNPNA